MNIGKSMTVALAAVLGLAIGTGGASAQEKSTWEQVMATKKLRAGMVDSPPNFMRDLANNTWQGAMVDMAKDLAKSLGVELELVDVGGWGQVVLALQSNKTDVQFSLQATPERNKAIAFAGPIRRDAYAMINGPKAKGFTSWAQYNRPEVKLSYQIGGASETIMKKLAPKATLLGHRNTPDIILALKAGQVDAAVSTVLVVLGQIQKDPTLGEFSLPMPEFWLPAYVGLRKEPTDNRMKEYIDMWAEWNALIGVNDQIMRDNLAKIGITEVPENVRF